MVHMWIVILLLASSTLLNNGQCSENSSSDDVKKIADATSTFTRNVYKDSKNVTLDIINAGGFVDQGAKVMHEFFSSGNSVPNYLYSAPANYSGVYGEARLQTKSWSANKTNDLIKEMYRQVASSAILCSGQCSDDSSSEDVKRIADATSTFTWNVYKEYVKAKPNDNLIMSGMSIAVVMAFLSEGTKGDTRTEILQTLQLPDDKSTVETGFQKTLSSIDEDSKNVTLDIGNAGFVDQGFELTPDFISDVQKYFLADFYSVDYRGANEEARQQINSWAANKTNDLIKEMYGQGELTPDTVLVLLNAVYFFGLWADQFDEKNTKDGTFYTIDGENKTVKMMSLEGHFAYREDDDLQAKIIELPYQGNEVSMVIVLPNDKDGLPELESKLSDFKGLYAGDWHRLVDLKMPKFEISTEIPLTDHLQTLGIKKIFSSGDFSAMSSNSGVSVSDVKQKAVIKVNEKGTEAAAVTGVGAVATSIQIPQEFYADRPFIYYIRHVCTNTIIFNGRLTSP